MTDALTDLRSENDGLVLALRRLHVEREDLRRREREAMNIVKSRDETIASLQAEIKAMKP